MTIPADRIVAARATDILASARRFVSLKRKGANEHEGPRPRCGGRDRFGVNTRKRVFNCRGCNARGDVIALVMIAKGVSFAEAVVELAGGARISSGGTKASAPDEKVPTDTEHARRQHKARWLW